MHDASCAIPVLRGLRSSGTAMACATAWVFGVEVHSLHRPTSFLALSTRRWLNTVVDVKNVFHGGAGFFV